MKTHRLHPYLATLFIGMFCLLSTSLTHAQEGDQFLINYAPNLKDIDNSYFDLKFSSLEEIVAANRSGVLIYNGTDWTQVQTPSAALSVSLGQNDEIFVGCADNFGRIRILSGDLRFESLTDSASIVFRTFTANDKVYFVQEHEITEFDPKENTQATYPTPVDEFIDYAFEFNSLIFVQAGQNLYVLKDSLRLSDPLSDEITGILDVKREYEGTRYAFVDEEGQVTLYDKGFTTLTELESYYATDVEWLSSNRIAINTLASGIIIYELDTREVSGMVNSHKGLPDDEILAMTSNRNGSLWVAHQFGFTWIAPDIPIRSFNYYPGLRGNLLTANRIEGKWYFGTSKGIYYFDRQENYKNIVYYVEKKTTPSAPPPQQQKSTREKKKLRLFGKKSKTSSDDQDSKGLLGFISNISLKGKKKPEYERRVRKELVSVEYLYKPIDGLIEKSKKIIPFNDQIIALTASGLVEIEDNEAIEIYEGAIQTFLQPTGTRSLLVTRLEGGVVQLQQDEDIWMQVAEIPTPGDVIITLYEDRDETVWMAGANTLFQVSLTDSVPTVLSKYDLENQYFDEIKITEIDNKIYLINNLGYFFVDPQKQTLQRDEGLAAELGLATKHRIQSDGRVWIYNGLDWYRINADKSIDSYPYLKLAPNLSFIDEEDNSLLMIDDNRSLLWYTPDVNDSIPEAKMFFKEVRGRRGLIPWKDQLLSFDHENNSFHIEMARPDYLGLLDIEYSHFLKGVSDDWSNWSRNSHIDFPFLPAGQYELTVRSRDAFGREQTSEKLEFRIRPPYWETAWFQAAQIAFFTILIFGSAHLNRRSANRRSRILTSIMTVLTVVLIIEFLQNLAGSYFGETGSPVFALLLDVVVALFVFPIEQVLKRIVSGQISLKQATDVKLANVLSKKDQED